MSTATIDKRFLDLEPPLVEAVGWVGILDRIIEDNVAKRAVSRADEEIILVHAQLRAAIERMDVIFNRREPEEEAR
jgi:hypothetical protein